MEYNKWVADLEPGDEIEGFYILKTAQIKTSNSGKPFLAACVADRSGAVDAKFWDYSGPWAPRTRAPSSSSGAASPNTGAPSS